MADHKHIFPIEKMSKVFGVSRSGYYRWLWASPSKRARENRRYRQKILTVWTDSRKRYGSPRIHRQLRRQGESLSRPRVARLMRSMGIASRIRSKWVVTTQSRHRYPVAPNLLERNFTADRIGEVLLGDITYLPSRRGWLYLTAVMDLADRKIVGWSLSNSMKAKKTTVVAWKEARRNRSICEGAIFHSDRGSQYACQEFGTCLSPGKVRQSMSRKGDCWDNAPMESFFKTLKSELVLETPFEDEHHARQVLFEFIEIWYNRQRLHSALDYRTPAEMEELLQSQKPAA
ncbi:MAG: IS3 family transposase [Balneolaceae bacterium]